MTEMGQVEIKKRLLSGVVDCELLSDTYELISALQAEILELKARNTVIEERCDILKKGLLFKNEHIDQMVDHKNLNDELRRLIQKTDDVFNTWFTSTPISCDGVVMVNVDKYNALVSQLNDVRSALYD